MDRIPPAERYFCFASSAGIKTEVVQTVGWNFWIWFRGWVQVFGVIISAGTNEERSRSQDHRQRWFSGSTHCACRRVSEIVPEVVSPGECSAKDDVWQSAGLPVP